ncbi:hypothetical protein ACFV7R_44610 [Streptomyces sp. NPDC059866]|uniref:hypothetical protein n=1 Tax=Streptomyces sp. NPDC059866 TaxID=3346978 RepID=UPI00365FE5CC
MGNSLPALAHTLVDAGLGDVEVLIEYPVPLSSYRMDALLAGSHSMTGRADHRTSPHPVEPVNAAGKPKPIRIRMQPQTIRLTPTALR